ncbi:hypothetical protein R6Q57_016796 [Mikania cordata]
MKVGEYIMKLAKTMIENHKASNDMEACMAKLGTMGWDESDAKYQTMLLFSEIWMVFDAILDVFDAILDSQLEMKEFKT